MQKYVGRVVEIIYRDRNGAFTKRKIRVISIHDGVVKAFCFKSGALRVFVLDQIMAIQPMAHVS